MSAFFGVYLIVILVHGYELDKIRDVWQFCGARTSELKCLMPFNLSKKFLN